MSEQLKECGCSIRAVRCEHFGNGSKVLLLDLADIIAKEPKLCAEYGLKRFCVQYEPPDSGPVCTGNDTDARDEAYEYFQELADHLIAHPESGALVGGFVIEVR